MGLGLAAKSCCDGGEGVEGCAMLRRLFVLSVFTAALCLPTVAQTKISTMPPEADKQLARDIYKEFIEIQSGYTT